MLKKWLPENLGIENYPPFPEEDLVTVFCHLRVRKARARASGKTLNDLDLILGGSKARTVAFLRTPVGFYLFYPRFKKIWRHAVKPELISNPRLRQEFFKYFEHIEFQVMEQPPP